MDAKIRTTEEVHTRKELLQPLWDLNKSELEHYDSWVRKLSDEELELTKLKCLAHRNGLETQTKCVFCENLDAEQWARNF